MNRSKPGHDDQSRPGSDFLQLDPAAAPPGALSTWLAAELRRAVADGRLPAGTRLPASRALAADLGVSRGVVTEAYQRLAEDGHVAGRGRSGTIVLDAVTSSAVTIGAVMGGPVTGGAVTGGAVTGGAVTGGAVTGGAVTGGAVVGSAGRPAVPGAAVPPARPGGLFAQPPDDGVFDAIREASARVDLSPGLPDLTAFPRAAWLRAERAVLAGLSPADLGYGDPCGTPALRRAVAGWLARTRGIRADPGDVIIVAGVSQALGLISRTLRDEGISTIAVEDPGSLGARQVLRGWRLDTPPVPVDAAGLNVAALRACGAPAVLTTPAHQFPTGVVLAGPRRHDLLRWSTEGGLIIEDDYDAEHRYDRPPVPALRSLSADVCYAGSVSKLLAPALRLGWILPPPRYRAAVVAAKRHMDLGNAALPQLVLARLITSGDLERQLRFLRRRHRRRRDVMIAALREHLPTAVVHGAAAGLHLLVTFPAGIPGTAPAGTSLTPADLAGTSSAGTSHADLAGTSSAGTSHADLAGTSLADTDLAAAALARGIKVQPLSWHAQRPCEPGLLLGYAASPPAVIAAAIAVLGELARGAGP